MPAAGECAARTSTPPPPPAQDELPDIPFAENPIFKRKFLPWGEVLPRTDSRNRLLQYVEYKTITVEVSSEGNETEMWLSTLRTR